MKGATARGLFVVVIAGFLHGASGAAGSLARSPEGLLVARNGDLYAVPLAGGQTVRLTRTRAWETDAAVSFDGTVVVFERAPTRGEPPQLWTMRTDGSHQAPLGVLGGEPAWAPDDDTIYFTRSHTDDNGQYRASVWRTDLSGRRAKRITTLYGLDTGPAVSPDGKTLAFGTGDCEPGFPCCIVLMSLATLKVRAMPKLPEDLDSSFNPSWAPDGRRIAFNTGLDDPSRTYVARPDGSSARPITRPTDFAHAPEWSPDGSLIAVIGEGKGSGNEDVYVIEPSGTGLRRVARTRDREFSVDWLPQMPSG